MSEAGDFRVIFIARDYDATVRFYRDVVEFPVVTAWDDHEPRGTILAAGNGTIEVFAPAEDQTNTFPSGFRLLVEHPDPDSWCARLREKGVDITVALVDRPWGYREFAVRDPNGIELFFYTVTDPERAGHG